MVLYLFSNHFWKRPGFPGVVDTYESDTSFRHQAGFRGAKKLKLENDGLFFEFLDGGVHFKKIAIAGRNKKVAIGSHLGHAEFLLLIAKKGFRGNAQMAQKFFNAFMEISKIADEIGHTIGVGITETNPHFGFVGQHVAPPGETVAN